MKKVILLTLLFALLSMQMSEAQVAAKVKNNPTAERIARKAIGQLKKSAYKARFAFIYYNAADETTSVNKGEIVIDNIRFRVEMNGIETKFDGLTQYVFVVDNNEVTVSEPSRDELVESNPMMMIEHYMNLHRVNMANDQVEGFDIINFFPSNPKNSEFFKIEFCISEATSLPVSMIMSMRSGDKITLQWDSFDVFVPGDDFFKFDKARYPGVEINDMR